jgi:TPR repeat protein
LQWYRRAAAQGHVAAQLSLGDLYFRGEGVRQDVLRALMWFDLAAASGDVNAVKSRDFASKELSSQQIDQAQKMARDCQSRQFKQCG